MELKYNLYILVIAVAVALIILWNISLTERVDSLSAAVSQIISKGVVERPAGMIPGYPTTTTTTTIPSRTACIAVGGGVGCGESNTYGPDECSFGSGMCSNQYHTECGINDYGVLTCERVRGLGNDECTINNPNLASECAGNNPKIRHTICSLTMDGSYTCESVQGPGQNECKSTGDCSKTSHRQCVNRGTEMNPSYSCEIVNGPGEDECMTHFSCTTASHNACVKKALPGGSWHYSCEKVDSPGQDECGPLRGCIEPYP